MEKQNRNITLENLLYILVIGLAVGVRLFRLGDAPLSDFEAGWALQSWKAIKGFEYQIGPNPAYFSLTTLIFSLFGSTEGLARLWPAFAGSLVVLVPLGLRRWLGLVPALVMAFGLAIDPGLVAISRLAGGPMMAIAFSMLAAVFLLSNKLILAGLLAGLAVISGPGIITGLLGLLVASLIARIAHFLPEINLTPEREPLENNDHRRGRNAQTFLFVMVLTGLFVATLFSLFPDGLGAWGNLLAVYLRGWYQPSGVLFIQPVLAVVFYQPLALLFGILSAIRGWMQGNKAVRWLSLWFVVALLLAMIYPGRQVYDAAWSLLPLWALAALELSRYFKRIKYPVVALGQAGILFVFLALFWLISLNIIPGGISWIVLVALLALIMIITILVGLGWSWDTSMSGFSWGISLSLGLYSLAGMVGISQIRTNHPTELWHPLPGVGQVRLLRETIQELGIIQNGRDDWVDIVSSVDSLALQWVLKDFSGVDYVSLVGPDILSAVIITAGDPGEVATSTDRPSLAQALAYRGQDFTWSLYPDWSGGLPSQWWRWVTIREAPTHAEKIILWARSDLFPEQPEADEVDDSILQDERLDEAQPLESIE